MLRSAKNSDMEYNETLLTLLQKTVKVWILNIIHIPDRKRKAKKNQRIHPLAEQSNV